MRDCGLEWNRRVTADLIAPLRSCDPVKEEDKVGDPSGAVRREGRGGRQTEVRVRGMVGFCVHTSFINVSNIVISILMCSR
jgi:hypothetical protein